MYFFQRFVPGLAIYSYFVADERTKEAAVIDPTRDVEEFLSLAKKEGFHIKHALETHVHADFVSGSAELKARLQDELTVHCSGMGGKDWTPSYVDEVLADSNEIRMGAVRLKAMHTPGHTPEHVSWVLFDHSRSADTPWLVFSGDFLFVGDVGRPDLLGEEARKKLATQLYTSVFDRLPGLPDFTEVFPGHGAGSLCGKAIGSRGSSTLGFERRFNGALQHRQEADWITGLLSGMPIAPPYFRRMKKVNAEGPKVLGNELPGQRRFSAKEVHDRICENCLVVDVRAKEAFSGAHIPGSVNIPLGPNLPTWAGWVLPYDKPVLIVVDNPSDMPRITTHLLRVGFDDVQGYLDDGMDAWENHGYELAHLESVSVTELSKRLKKKERPFILDVRTEREWESGHVEGSHHIHGGLLQERFDEVPKDRPISVICGSGYRGSIASSFLMREGYREVSNVLGGMTAWRSAGYPTVADPQR